MNAVQLEYANVHRKYSITTQMPNLHPKMLRGKTVASVTAESTNPRDPNNQYLKMPVISSAGHRWTFTGFLNNPKFLEHVEKEGLGWSRDGDEIPIDQTARKKEETQEQASEIDSHAQGQKADQQRSREGRCRKG